MAHQLKTIPELLQHNSNVIPDELFLMFYEKRYSFGDIDRLSNQVANYFAHQFGIKKGDHIALILKNCPEYLFIWFGLAKLGAVMVPINHHIKGDSLQYILTHSDSKLVIVDAAFLDQLKAINTDLVDIQIIELGDFQAGYESESIHRQVITEVDESDPMSIIYTSGTTGLPKGVILPHYSYINTGMSFRDSMVQATKEDVLYTCLPLFHCNAQQLSVMGAMLTGCPLALSERFSASKFWQEIQYYQATVFNYIGSILTVLYKQPFSEYEQNNTVTRTFGGAAPKEIWTEFEERFELKIVEGYGLTETATVCLCNPKGNIRVGSIGKPLPNVDVKIVDENERDVLPGEEGEIIVKELVPNTIFKGYYKMPQKTQEVMKGGWFHTGDRGYMDEDGYFYFKDRIKDCIRYRGENISSYEIERIVNKHPQVKESAAIGVPSELGEEDVKVVLVVEDESVFDYVEFIKFCEERMAYYMVPRYIELRSFLPKTATERVQKFALRKEGIGSAWDRVREGVKLNRK
ncbi:crotonobetaine/carnitine-CoA ligase [Caldalkalibacillus uzonensis]|uniref:Crotonobetaine/carnitine-CoA ligase n=1 Tax=Caldalkalibacillus uzonensis TaxID=353224 RepID=A0ABU0CY96_9BACI|nr:ATP-dependent acyl-CoA ligase [Caldalkalibacillus uzonensis]MDQ0341114.1 crotonobetaine/carnitine-CoA ligase [Caldalkalibacillus uzonensis]